MNTENEFRVQFLLFGGTDGSSGKPDAVFFLHAVRGTAIRGVGFPNSDAREWEASASLLVAESANDAVTFTRYARTIRSTDLESLRESLRVLRGGGERLRVQSNFDTSLGWMHLSLAVFDAGQEWTLELPLRLSGFSGEQADELDRVIQIMIRIVGANGAWIQKRLRSIRPI
jgi:hypothetical protein